MAIKGAKGELKIKLPPGIEATLEKDAVWVKGDAGESGALLGTAWALVKNTLEGVAGGFSKILEIEGVGYRAVLEGKELVLFLGYAQPVRVSIPAGVAVAIEKSTITVSGIDKNSVGLFAANVRALKKPEPYKGKGFHYKGEVVRRKVGKKAGATASS